jgi:hypothetical protein
MITSALLLLLNVALFQDGALPAPRLLPSPPVVAAPRPVTGRLPRTRLALISRRANEITDDAAWFARTSVRVPEYRIVGKNFGDQVDLGPVPMDYPGTYQGAALARVLRTAAGDPAWTLLQYGEQNGASTYLVGWDGKAGALRYALDFSQYGNPIGFALEDRDGTLYVANAYNGYAKEVKNQTAYVTAIEPKSGKMLWRTGPLKQNAYTFADGGDVLICGYGFTAEPDFLYLIDKKTGRTVQTIPVKSGPSHILRQGDRVYVRCYDTDYVFALKAR